MVQTITPALEALLKQKLLVGDETFMGEVVLGVGSGQEEAFRVDSFDVNFSLGLQAAELNVTLSRADTNHQFLDADITLWWPNNRIQAWAWYGARTNAVCIFTGLVDRLDHHRDPSRISIKARSRMKWLMEQKFQATAPQGVDEEGAVRTEANGVYVGVTVYYIVNDILDRAGWPTADRVIDDPGLDVDEYVLPDNTSWAECIAGAARLTDMSAYDLWETPLGIIHFQLQRSGRLTDALPSDYEFEAGVDVLALDYSIDDEDRATRAIVTGPMTTAIPAWTETWATTVLRYPVGVWHDPADPDNLRVIDAVNRNLYTIRQSDRAIIATVSLGAPLAYYAGGLSGDPVDATIYWVLDIDWIHGATNEARIRKFDKATNALLDTYTLADGQWTDLKSDGVNLWATRFDTDALYKLDISDGSVIASYTYSGLTNPTGMYLNGTTIGLFFNNGTKFHLVNTATPGTIVSTQSTVGTHILGGEIDAVTGTDLYAVAATGSFGNSAGYVWKFALSAEVTNNVQATYSIQQLEDDLGDQSGIGNRVHDLHPGDAAHAFEIRPVKYTMRAVQSTAQAAEVASIIAWRSILIREVLDLATLGNPAIELNDVCAYTDPLFVHTIQPLLLLDDAYLVQWVVDAYRMSLSATGGFTTRMSLLPRFTLPG